MRVSLKLIKRNIKLFFRDKGMFFTALVTPAILLVLYATFLGSLYRSSFTTALGGLKVSDSLLDGLVGSQLVSSILAVSCITVAFSSNFLMVQDKVNGTIKDLTISPVKSSVLSLSYYIATLLSTLLVCLAALLVCLVYLRVVGWYMSGTDVLKVLADILCLTLFGTALSSVINSRLTTQGQISAVGSIVSAGYGFICGAYMPIASFGEKLQTVLSFLPGTYGTSLIRNHLMQGVLGAMKDEGVPEAVVEGLKDSLDMNFYFSEKLVSISTMYIVLVGAIVVLLGGYVLLNMFKKTGR